MNRIALVDTEGKIVNVIVGGADYTPPDEFTAVADSDGRAEIDGSWDGTNFHPPVREITPAKKKEIAKTTIYRRATDQELELLNSTLPTLPLRERLMWQDALGGTVYVDEVLPFFVAVVGAQRAAELLA